MTWFRNKDDVGVVHHEHFSPMPISIIALTLTVVMIALTTPYLVDTECFDFIFSIDRALH